MKEMNDVVVLRGIIKSNPDLRTEVLEELSKVFAKRGYMMSGNFLEHITIASSEEISSSGAHVVELD